MTQSDEFIAPWVSAVGDLLHIKLLAAHFTLETLSHSTWQALAAHTKIGDIMSARGGDCDEVLAWFAAAGARHRLAGRSNS